MRRLLLLLISICFTFIAKAQQTLPEFVELLNQYQVKHVSSEHVADSISAVFAVPNNITAKGKQWVEKPKKGNGFGIYQHKGYTYECNWKDYKFDGELTIKYKGLELFTGKAENGIIKEGIFYKLRYFMPLPSDETPDEFKEKYKDVWGIYAIPVYTGTVHHITTAWDEDWLQEGTGVHFETHWRSKFTHNKPRLYSALYSKRLLGERTNLGFGLLDSNTWYFINKAKQDADLDEWSCYSVSFIENGKLQGEFVSASQDKYAVMARFSAGQNSHLYRVFDEEKKDYINFDSQQFSYEINEEKPYLTYINYYNDEEWVAHLQEEEDKIERAERNKELTENYQKQQQQAYEEEQRQKQLEWENRWQRVATNCEPALLPGEAEHDEFSTRKVTVGFKNGDFVTETIPDFSVWLRARSVYEKETDVTYVATWSANYVYDHNDPTADYKALVAATLANAIFPSSEFLSAMESSNMRWELSLTDTDKEPWFFKYTDRDGYTIFVRAKKCDSSINARIISAPSEDFENHPDFKKFMFYEE